MTTILRICLSLVGGFILGFIPILARAKTIEMKSENFIMVGDVSQKEGKALLFELEQYRQAIFQILGIKDVEPEIIPVRIYTAKNDKEFTALTGQGAFSGFYTSTLEGPVFVLNSAGGFKRGKRARTIALHEYTHHLLATYSNSIYPRWFDEGLANYYSTFEVDKKGRLVIGRPYQPYGYPLSQKTWMQTNIVVNSVLHYPFSTSAKRTSKLSDVNYFYAQSWLAVHYIRSVKGEPEKFGKYIDLINSEKNKSSAFTEGFGRTPEEFHAILKAYYKRNRFPTLQITPSESMKAQKFYVKNISKGMAEFHKAEAMRSFINSPKRIPAIKAQYKKAAAVLGENAFLLSALADLEMLESNHDQAKIYMNRALDLAPDNAVVLRTAGMILVRKNGSGSRASDQELKQARKYLHKAMVQNPNDISAHYYYAMTYGRSRYEVSKQAIASAKTALNYYRAKNFTNSNLNIVDALIAGEAYEEARSVLQKALIWSEEPNARMFARRELKHIKQR